MSFQSDVSAFTAAEIIAALGCPRATAYCWLDGTREPPAWQHPHWIAILQRSVPRKSNPASQETSRKRRSK